eukprot:262719-Chlamydomonas_euryale.AAC.2
MMSSGVRTITSPARAGVDCVHGPGLGGQPDGDGTLCRRRWHVPARGHPGAFCRGAGGLRCAHACAACMRWLIVRDALS